MNSLRHYISTKKFVVPIALLLTALLLFLLSGCEEGTPGLPVNSTANQSLKWVDVNKAESEHSPIRISPSSVAVTTTIEFDMASEGIATLTINDGQDVNILTLVDHQELMPGTYETNFNASRLASGVYLYELEIKYSNTQEQLLPPVRIIRKMLLIK